MRWTVLAASSCLLSAAHAGTLLFRSSQAGDYAARTQAASSHPPDGTFRGQPNVEGRPAGSLAGGPGRPRAGHVRVRRLQRVAPHHRHDTTRGRPRYVPAAARADSATAGTSVRPEWTTRAGAAGEGP